MNIYLEEENKPPQIINFKYNIHNIHITKPKKNLLIYILAHFCDILVFNMDGKFYILPAFFIWQ
jgi:hypothetical protein